MNKIFKVIFSKAKGCYVVVSELAKSAGKGTSASHIQRGYSLTLAAAVLSMMMGMAPVGAADPVNLDNGASAYYDDKGNLTIGDEKTVAEGTNKSGKNNTTIGTQSDTLRNVTEGDTKKDGQPLDGSNTKLVDGEGKAHPLDLSTEAGGSTAVGYDNHNEGDNSTAIGNNARITNKPVTYYVDADGKKTASLENAVWYKDTSGNPTKVPQVFRDADGNTTTTPQYVHTYTEKDPDTKEDVTKTEITSDATKADQKDGQPVYNYQPSDNTPYLYTVTLYQAASNSIAAGTNVTANGNNAVAVGYKSTADNSAVAIGDTAEAKENAVAMGKDTKATAKGSIALGKGSEANRDGGVTGWDPKTGKASTNTDAAWQSGEGTLSIGNGGASRQITHVAAGSEDSDAVNLAQLKNAMTHYYSVKTTSDTDAAGKNNYLNDGATGDNALAAGVSAAASGDRATAVGYNTSASGSDAAAFGSGSKVTDGGIAVGNSATASGNGASFGTTGVNASSGGLAVGISGTTASDKGVAVGLGVNAFSGGMAVGMYGTNASSNSAAFGLNSTTATNSSVAVGANGTTAANSSFAAGFTSKAGTSSSSSYGTNIAVGSNTTADNGSSAFGIDATANNQSLAIGLHGNSSSAYATNQSIAVGNGTNAFNYSTAIGNTAKAGNNGSYAVALGNEASALYDQTTAIGSGAKVISPYGTALGSGTSAAYYATALGNSASANYSYATALGYTANASNTYATAVGNNAGAHGNNATALGNGASANTANDTAIGSGAVTGGENGTALGSDAKAQSPYATALGSSAEASYHAVAIGDATASSSYALAAGDGATAAAAGGVALGSSSTANVASGKTGLDPHTGAASTDTGTTWVSTLGAVSVGTVDSDGNATGTRQINGLAAGTKDTDAVNVAQLKAMETRINMHYYSVNSTLSGDGSNYDNTGASGTNALAAGPMASATVENAVAIGYGAQAEGKGATVIGQYGEATGRYALAFGGQQTDTTAEQADNMASGDNALSFGERTTASGTNSTAFGWQTTAKEKRATAFGERTTASGANATAFGQLATASGQNSTAFGNEARANNYGSTAFGNRTEALGEYSTAFGNSTVAAGMNTVAFGTDNVAGAVLDDNGAYTNIIYKTNAKGRVVKDENGNPIELSREKMDARGNLAYTDGSSHTKSVTYTVPGGETHNYVLLQGDDGNTYIRDYRGDIRSATIGTDGKVTVGDTALTNVTLKKANAGANGYHILSNANATVWGENSIASGEASTAFGVSSIAAAKNSLAALGGTTTDTATNSAAIGKDARATLEDSVALGSGAVADRKSGAKGYDMLTKGDTTNTTAAWVSRANAIAVGKGSTLTRQITGVAAGSQDTDAVNVAQLKAAGFKVTTQNDGSISSAILNGDTLDFEGKDNAIVSTSKDSKTITVAVSRTPTFDSATFYNPNPSEGQHNEKVTISNGHISTYNKDQQERAVIGTDNQGSGTLHLINNDLSQVHVYTQNSKEDGNDGITRMYYISSSGNGGEIQGVHTIAVLDDGINYAGDNVKSNTQEKVVVKHKLNSTMDVTGGADTNNLSDNNIGVVATPAVEDDKGNITQKGKLEIKLNRDVTGLNTVTAGTAKIGHTDAGKLKTTQNGAETSKYADAGDYVTGLTNTKWDTKNPEYVSGRAATEDELATVSGDVTTNANNITTNATNIQNNANTIAKGLSFTTNTQDATNTTDNYKGYKVVNRKLGDTIAIKAGDADPSHHYAITNLTTEIANNGDITIKMDENPTFNVVTATSVNLSPKDNTTKDQNGYTASAQLDAHYRGGSLNPDKNVIMADGSTGMVRLHYHDGEGTIHDLATMDDGQIYAGDIQENGTLDTTGFGRKMNEKTTINGGVIDKDNLTDNNIGVVSNGTNTLTVKLAKNLKDLQSVQTGKTTIDDKGLTIRKSDDDSSKNVIVLGDQVAFGDNQVNNMGSGASKITEDDKGNKTYEYNTLNNGANIGDVKNIASSTVQPVIDTVNKGWELDVNSTKQKAVTPTSPKVNLIQGQNITITGDTANTDNVTISTADDVRFNTVRVGGAKTGTTYSGGIVIGKQSGGDSANPDENDYITGLKNTNWDSNKIQSGRAATEDQLKKVADDIKQGTVDGDVYVTGGEVSYHTDGGTDNGKPTFNDGTGKLTLTENNKTSKVEITGLHDYYVTNGTVTDDGKTLELTRNDRDEKGNPQKISVDLSNVLKSDKHLVANPDATDGKYTVNTTDGTVTLKVKNGDKYDDITIGGFEGLGKGFKFGANKMAKDGGGNPVTNQLGSAINVTGAGTKDLQDYSGKNLLTSVEQDADGNTTIHVLMDRNISADGVTVGQAGTDGVAGADGEVGQAGTIGINGKNGVAGTDGKQGITTTIIRTEKGQAGKDGEIGQQGAPGVDGKDITRIVYQNEQDKVDGKDGSHTVATLDDGLKFSGDDNSAITKKLNEQLQFVGGADKTKLTENNIGINEKDGKLLIQLVENPNLGQNGNLTAGTAKIGHFNGNTLSMTKNGKEDSGNYATSGSYATGLSNKEWNVSDPEYVSGRAATEDQLKVVNDAIGKQVAAKSDYQLVANDKTGDGSYTPENGTLKLQVKDPNNANAEAKTITINDIASKSKVDEALDRTVKYDMKDGKVDKTHVTFEATDEKGNPVDTQVSHMASGASEIQDDGNGHKTYVYNTDNNAANIGDVKNIANSLDAEVTKKGLNFKGNDGQEIHRDLGTTLNIVGGINDQKALDKKTGTTSSKNLGVRKSDDNSLEIVMTDTPDFEKVTIGKGTDTTQKIIIGEQTVTGKKSDGSASETSQNGNYITGLDNKAWDKDNVVENRAATEGQLRDAINSVNGSVDKGFGLADEAGTTVKKKLGDTITVKGDTVYAGDGKTVVKDGNIKTAVNDDAIQISLNDQISIGQKGEQGEQGQPGTPGKDGKFTVETKGGTTVVIGHDGKDGEPGRDGLFVTGKAGKDGKDGESGVSITGPNGQNGIDGKIAISTPGKDGQPGKDAVSISGQNGEGHIGLTGPKGEPGADGTPGKDGISIDITTDLKTATLDDGKNVKTVIKDKDGKETTIEQAPRIQYKSGDNTYEVATMDDGLKFVGNDGKEVAKKLNSTLSLTGGIKDATDLQNASGKNLGVRSNEKGDGLEIVMTDTPDFTKVTVGEGNDTTGKITIGKQTVTGKKSDGSDGAAQTGNYITGLDNKAWDKDNVVENRAATEGQLRDIAGSITNQTQGGGFALTSDEKGDDKIVKQDLGKAIQIKGDTTYKTDGSVEKAGNIKTSIDNGAIKVGLNKDVDLGNDGSVSAGQTKVDKNGVDTNKITIKDSTISISKDGINGGSKQITDIASGASEIRDDGKGNKTYVYNTDTNAANIGDVKRIAGDMKNDVANVTKNVTDVTNRVDNIQNDVTQLKTDVKADRTYQGDDGADKKVKVKFGSFLSLTGGAQLADLTEEGNIGVVQKEIDDPDHKDAKITGLSVRLAKRLNLEKTTYTSEENGQTYRSEIDGKGLIINTGDANRTITVQDGNVNMGGNQIHHVAPGQAPDDAVNVSQLNATNYAVNKLDTRVNRVGANAAALAALHPLDFDPDDKWDFSAGYGHYKDANAAAVGAFYRPNEDTMFSVGGSFGGGENMVNAGVSVKLGQGNHVSTSRVAMAKEIKDLKKDVAALKAVVNQQSALIDKLTGVNAGELSGSDDLFPDVPANHWAYEYVTRLKQAGILTGYPDGNFAGDRMMTRYEFAAIVYRAIMAGAAANPSLNKDGTLDRLAKEFSSEMKYIRIDTIRKDRNGRPTIQRVRVIKEDEK